MHCIFVLGSGYDVAQEKKVKSFWGSTFMKLEKTNFLLFISKGKYQCISPLYKFYFITILKLLLTCAFMLSELNETLECIIPFLYHLDPIMVEILLVVLCLAD
jgi:hypothetical protein